MRQSSKQQLQRCFPESVDLLAVCVSAGASLPTAMDYLAGHGNDAMSPHWRAVVHDIRIGVGQRTALTSLADELDFPAVRMFVAAVNQASELGLDIAPILRIQAEHARKMRHLALTEQAQRIPVLVLFPLLLCLLPALLLLVIGPAAFAIRDQLIGV